MLRCSRRSHSRALRAVTGESYLAGVAEIRVCSSKELFAGVNSVIAALGAGQHAVFDLPRFRYVQLRLTDGVVALESVANRYLFEEAAVPLTVADEARLVLAGWRAPAEPKHPNWWRDLDTDDFPRWAELAVDMLCRTMIDIHGWRPAEPVHVAIGASQMNRRFPR